MSFDTEKQLGVVISPCMRIVRIYRRFIDNYPNTGINLCVNSRIVSSISFLVIKNSSPLNPVLNSECIWVTEQNS